MAPINWMFWKTSELGLREQAAKWCCLDGGHSVEKRFGRKMKGRCCGNKSTIIWLEMSGILKDSASPSAFCLHRRKKWPAFSVSAVFMSHFTCAFICISKNWSLTLFFHQIGIYQFLKTHQSLIPVVLSRVLEIYKLVV